MQTIDRLAFDPFQFAGRLAHPVSASFIGGEIQSNGIAWEDYRGMHSFTPRAPGAQRRLKTPEWASNTSKLRELLVAYIERRAQLLRKQPGTHAERLARAKAKLAARTPRMVATLDKLCREYVALKKEDPTAPRVKKLAEEIENLDTVLRFNVKPEIIVAGVVAHYYRLGSNSTETATALSMKPPHVRCVLHRLNALWEEMEAGTAFRPAPANPTRSVSPREATRATGLNFIYLGP